jgi:catalase
LPINAPLAPVHNNQRDGMHRQAIHRGRASYEPNSLGGGCPFQAGTAGFVSFPEPVQQDEVRGKPEKFAEHYQSARLFYESQAPFEQQHIAAAFRFELSKVTIAAVRERVVSMLRNASEDLAASIADGLGMQLPDAMPKALENPPAPEIERSPRLSLTARPGDGGIRTRKVAIMIAPGTHGATAWAVTTALQAQVAVVRFVGPRIGPLATSDGDQIDADASLENQPAVLFDGVVIPDGAEAIDSLSTDGLAREFIQDQYRHCKTILALGDAAKLLNESGINVGAGTDPGLIVADGDAKGATEQFIKALAKHRHYERETQPPKV